MSSDQPLRALEIDERHVCPHPDCNRQVPHYRLACPKHWYALPAPLRRRVWQTYRDDEGGPTHRAAIGACLIHYQQAAETVTR